ncbi:hypothetical protein N3K66_008828 [Trichothecium roseum]|uniref:Uncharacterized protein n=1 Tax=Trichothecium roseum TaxID=47278 RepID=A0ACC0USM6_9HYPO|nr:hypothetical protein N3K66_008828 [Trichothecium roseum]
MTVFQIDIVSDFVCAWCFILHRNIRRAIALYQKTYPGGSSDAFDIVHHPYYLNYNNLPDLNYATLERGSLPKSVVADRKLAHMSAEQREALAKKFERIGRGVGIEFRHGGNVGRTVLPHRLLRTVAGREVQETLAEALFSAYHEQERDISDPEVVREIARGVGIAEGHVNRALDDESDLAREVDEEEARNRAGVAGKGVPVVTIQGEKRVEGAGDIMEFMEMFIEVKERAPTSTTG